MSVDSSYDLTGTSKINHLEYRLAKRFDANWDNKLSNDEWQNLLKAIEKGIPPEYHMTDDLHPDNQLSWWYIQKDTQEWE